MPLLLRFPTDSEGAGANAGAVESLRISGRITVTFLQDSD